MADSLIPATVPSPIPSLEPVMDPPALAARILRGSEYDFASLRGSPALMLDRPPRRGVTVIAARTTDLPDEALDAILAWRLGQYVLTGFYDPGIVAATGMTNEPRDSVHDQDIHFLALDDDGGLLAYITLKQPPEIDGRLLYRHRDRPLFPCEEVHGRHWQNSLIGVDEVELRDCWEFGRFVKDQRRASETITHRGALELALGACRLVRHPDHQAGFRLVTGDLDPEVALKSLRFFFVPVATFPAHRASLPEGHPLAPRYEQALTAPFVADAEDVDNATYVRWADLDLALTYEDEAAAIRLMALRQF